jgi:dethiobiotin synthetase
MNRLFVTSTGTGIGKTLVTAVLVRQLRAAGRGALALKPIISGFEDASAGESDTGVLLRAMDRPVVADEIAAVSPWRFSASLSPDMAARREGREIDVAALTAFCAGARADHVLIEGVGGAFVPLDARRTVADWIAALDIPALLVAGSYLGTLSHTIATLEALAARRVTVRAIVVSESPESPVPLEETRASLARFVGGVPIALLPRIADWTQAPDLTPLVLGS